MTHFSAIQPQRDAAALRRTVAVVGSNSDGLRTALEQAEAGRDVYLIEAAPALGAASSSDGPDLTLLAAVRCHPRIHVIANAELQEATEQSGRFRLRLLRHPTMVDEAKCDSCERCVRVCPAPIADKYSQRLRRAIDSHTPGHGGYHIVREAPPCQQACPVHLDVRGYCGHIADGQPAAALALIRRELAFPGIIGRICSRPCEGHCNRGTVDDPVAICALKRYVCDDEGAHGVLPESVPLAATGKRVAVIGSGPAGLACAYHLALFGHQVVVFEALSQAGGMLRFGIPAYRLPRPILELEIAQVATLGVDIRPNLALGRDMTVDTLVSDGFHAVFLAMGAQGSRRLEIAGAEADGVLSGVAFLRSVNVGGAPHIGPSVVIIGGGDVAVDSARCAVRLGAKAVTILYRRAREAMPARAAELEAALAEGVKVQFLAAPERILLGEGKVRGLRCCLMSPGETDRTGRPSVRPIPGSQFDLAAGTVISAIGQLPETAGVDGLALSPAGTIVVDPVTLATARRGIFAGGDVVSGPRTAIEAIAAGRKAAQSIHCYLGGRS